MRRWVHSFGRWQKHHNTGLNNLKKVESGIIFANLLLFAV